MSFIRNNKSNKFFDFMDAIYRPVLDPISKLLSPLQKNIGLDFAPIILILLLNFISDSLARIA